MAEAQAKNWLWTVTLVVAAVGVRLVAACAEPGLLATDPDGYVALAESIAAGRGFVDPATGTATAYRPPLFPLLLAFPASLLGRRLGVLAVQLFLSGLLVLSTRRIGRRLDDERGHLIGTMAAAVVVFDPMLTLYSLQPMTEVVFPLLATMLIAMGLEVDRADREGRSSRGWMVACGGVFGLAALCRPTIWAWAVLIAGFAVVRSFVSKYETRSRRTGAVAWWPAWVAAVLVVMPWPIRNAAVIGRPVVMTTHGGYTLLLANNPVFYDEVVRRPWGTVWERESLLRWQRSLEDGMAAADPPVEGELERDDWMRRRAVSNMRSDVPGFLWACVVRIGRFWNPAPLTGSLPWPVRWGAGLFNGLVFVLAMVGLCRIGSEGRRRLQPALLLIASLTLVHAVYWSNARMRAPLIPVLAVLAAVGADRSARGLARHKAQ